MSNSRTLRIDGSRLRFVIESYGGGATSEGAPIHGGWCLAAVDEETESSWVLLPGSEVDYGKPIETQFSDEDLQNLWRGRK